MGFIEDVQLAEWNLQQANLAYCSRLEAAEKCVDEAQRLHEAKAKSLERQLVHLKKPIDWVGKPSCTPIALPMTK